MGEDLRSFDPAPHFLPHALTAGISLGQDASSAKGRHDLAFLTERRQDRATDQESPRNWSANGLAGNLEVAARFDGPLTLHRFPLWKCLAHVDPVNFVAHAIAKNPQWQTIMGRIERHDVLFQERQIGSECFSHGAS